MNMTLGLYLVPVLVSPFAPWPLRRALPGSVCRHIWLQVRSETPCPEISEIPSHTVHFSSVFATHCRRPDTVAEGEHSFGWLRVSVAESGAVDVY